MKTEIIESFSIKELPESELEMTGEVPVEEIEVYRDRALAEIAKGIEMPGFRLGHVPSDLALKKVGEVAVLEEAVELFVRDFYPELLIAKKINAVGRPDIRITKLAPGNPVGLLIHTAVYPTITLPKGWQAIAQDIPIKKPEPVSDEALAETLASLQKSRATKGEDGTDMLPELTDEFARSVGTFTDLEDLKAKMRQGMEEEKERSARDTRRSNIVDALVEKTTMSVPRVFVESELEKIFSQLKEDVMRFKMTLEDYLKRVGKTEEELREEFRSQAEKRAKLQLLLNEIADQEKIEPEQEAVDAEMKHAIEHFPDAKENLLRIHVETVLRNEKVLQLLELGDKKE